jgi:hypothetical protein
MDLGTLPMEGGSRTRCLRNVVGSHIVTMILANIVSAKEYIYSLLMIAVDRLATLQKESTGPTFCHSEA